MFTLGDRSVVTPAVVYLREDGVLVTGEAANLRGVSSPDRVGREFKRRLGNPTPVVLGGQPHTVTTLLGTLLRDVVRKVVETEGEPPDHVLLTHPANWGPFRRALFEEVPQHAGLTDPSLVTEPEAAAAHYAASRQLDDGEIMAVYDLGGGTFDATVLRKKPGGVEILGTPEGIERLGGIDFDEAILSYVDYTAGGVLRELDMGDLQTTVALARLRQDCVLAKEALSVDTETILPVFLPGRHFDVHLTRSDFEDMVRAPIESTIGALSRTLQSAQVDPADLSAVLLVGGSSRIPLVARMVSAELGRPTVVDTHPKYAVALGAATLVAQAFPANGAQVAFDGRRYAGGPATQVAAPEGAGGPTGTPAPTAAEVDSGARSRQRARLGWSRRRTPRRHTPRRRTPRTTRWLPPYALRSGTVRPALMRRPSRGRLRSRRRDVRHPRHRPALRCRTTMMPDRRAGRPSRVRESRLIPPALTGSLLPSLGSPGEPADPVCRHRTPAPASSAGGGRGTPPVRCWW
jgi:actin-like ATPase involved in cell morphogenesis